MEKLYVTPQEASEMTGIRLMAIYQMAHRGKIPFEKMDNGRIFVDVSELKIVNDKESYITVPEAKKEYGVAESTVRTAIRSGRMPAVRADNSGRAKWLIPKGFRPEFMNCKNPEYRKEMLHEAHINVNLGKSLNDRLMEYVGKSEVRRSDVFRGALDEYLEKRGF